MFKKYDPRRNVHDVIYLSKTFHLSRIPTVKIRNSATGRFTKGDFRRRSCVGERRESVQLLRHLDNDYNTAVSSWLLEEKLGTVSDQSPGREAAVEQKEGDHFFGGKLR